LGLEVVYRLKRGRRRRRRRRRRSSSSRKKNRGRRSSLAPHLQALDSSHYLFQ